MIDALLPRRQLSSIKVPEVGRRRAVVAVESSTTMASSYEAGNAPRRPIEYQGRPAFPRPPIIDHHAPLLRAGLAHARALLV